MEYDLENFPGIRIDTCYLLKRLGRDHDSISLIVGLSRLPWFLPNRFSTRYSSRGCAILPAQKALDNEFPFRPLSMSQRTDETGGKSLRRSQ
jgi:hypothetical protein